MTLANPEQQSVPKTPEQSRFLRTLSEGVGFTPEENARPERCRAIIFNPDGTKVLGIVRQKPGREAYIVTPGGGVEEEDSSAVAAVRRELSEELELTEVDVYLNGRVISFDDEVGGNQFYYLGQAREEFEDLTIHGPEADRDASTSGTYTPTWIDVDHIEMVNFQPLEVAKVIAQHRSSL